MEDRLTALISGNSPANRKKWALEAKEEGKRVIGLLCSYVPEEVIYAAGMLPWRITGVWDLDLSRALVYRDADTCKYCTHALESLLRGELDFLDGVVGSNWDDDRRRLYDVWCYVGKPRFSQIIGVPTKASPASQQYFAREIRRLASALEDLGGRKISEQALWRSIATFNRRRENICKLYEMRKRAVPPVSGAEMLGITTAAAVMDPEHFNSELETLLSYIEGRNSGLKPDRPRILVSSDLLDNPAHLATVEDAGCNIVMDDLDTGSRRFWVPVPTDGQDPFTALAEGYCLRPTCPPAFDWEEQGERIVGWVQEFRAHGVLEMAEDFSPARHWRAPVLRQVLARAGIPYLAINREYALGSVGATRTRVQAWLEMLDGEGRG